MKKQSKRVELLFANDVERYLVTPVLHLLPQLLYQIPRSDPRFCIFSLIFPTTI